MEKLLINEINRMKEILGLKTVVNEQLLSKIMKKFPQFSNDVLAAAKNKLGKVVSNIEDLTVADFKALVKGEKNNAISQFKKEVLNGIESELAMSPIDFASKTRQEIYDEFAQKGLDDDIAGSYFSWYSKKHQVKTKDGFPKDKPTAGGGLAPITIDPNNFTKQVSNVTEFASLNEIKSNLKLLVPNATEQEIANAAIKIREIGAKKIETLTQKEFNDIFQREMNGLSSNVRQRIIKESNKIPFSTRWDSLPSFVKKAVYTLLVLGSGSLGLWGLVADVAISGAQSGVKDVKDVVKKKFGDTTTTQNPVTPPGGNQQGSGTTKKRVTI